LHRAEGLPIKVIARTLKISKNTVKSALACEAPPKYERPPRGSKPAVAGFMVSAVADMPPWRLP
jgi:hypothetical protein